METTLFKILYCSRNFIGDVGTQPDREIEQILQVARSNNREHGVTGALLYNSGYFAQVLEGPRPAIEKIFEVIQRDPRHGDITVLECSNTQERDFPEWSMARVQPLSEAQEAGALTAIHQAIAHPEASGNQVLDLLRSLVIQDE